jgi:hypothetical protein
MKEVGKGRGGYGAPRAAARETEPNSEDATTEILGLVSCRKFNSLVAALLSVESERGSAMKPPTFPQE